MQTRLHNDYRHITCRLPRSLYQERGICSVRLLWVLLLEIVLWSTHASAQILIPEIRLPPELFAKLQQSKPSPNPQRAPQSRRSTFDVLRQIRSWDDLEREFRNTITLNGRKVVGFHLQEIEGDRNAFRDQNYFGQGGQRFTDNTDLFIRVNKFLGFLSLDWRWNNQRYRNPFDTRITYTYESPNFRVEWGDIQAILGGNNPLVGFNRTLRGVTANAQWGRTTVRYINSETKAGARTVTIPGNDSPGPYYLQGSQIVDGSERVQVDGVEKKRGEDYTIDYYVGILRFRDGMIIPRTSTIVVTYETYAYNAQPSRLDGFRIETNLRKDTTIGFSMLSQKARARLQMQTRTERFAGQGPPSNPYDLEFVPAPNTPIQITVGGVPQQQGVDYYFDSVLPYRFYFTRFMPSSLTVIVTYVPRPDTGSTIGGDREVMGLDVSFPLGKSNSVVWNIGRSKAQTLGSTLEAIAHVVSGRFQLGKIAIDSTYRNIPAEFIGIESIGFRRNERGHQTSLTYSLNPTSRIQLSLNQSRIASLNTGSQFSTTFTDTDYYTVSYTHSPANGYAFTFNRVGSVVRAPNARSSQTRYSVNLSRNWKTVSMSLGFDQSDSESRSIGNVSSFQKYEIQSITSRVEWRISQRLSVSGNASQNTIRQHRTAQQTERTRSQSKDYSLNATWQPNDRLSINYRWSDVDSGTLGRDFFTPRSRQVDGFGSGFQNPWGVGYNGNGFSSGAPLYSGYTYYGVRGKGQDLGIQWRPNDQISLDLQWSEQRSAGDFQTNSAQKTLTAGVTYLPRDWLMINLNWSRQEVQFLTATGFSNNEYLTVGAEIGPLKRWNFSLNYYQMVTKSVLGEGFVGGAGNYSQEPYGFSARITYDLGRNHNLFADYRFNELRGYLGSRDTELLIGYQYRLSQNLSFVLNYRFREQLNADPQYTQYNYRVRSLDAGISLNF